MTLHFSSVDQALRKARASTKKGAVGEAQAAYRWVLDKYPDNRRAREGLQTLRSGAATEGGSNPPPKDQIDRLLQLHAHRRFADALPLAQSLATLHPNTAFLFNFVGVCHSALGQPHLAIPRYKRALQLSPDAADIHINLGDALNALGRPAEAIDCFRRAIELNPVAANAHNNLGSALIAVGAVAEAAESFAAAAKVDPGLVDAHANLGLALIKLGRLEEGAASCRHAIKLDHGFVLGHINLANAYDAGGNIEAAIECLETAIGLQPDHAGAHSNLCEIYDRLNRVDDLRRVVERAREHCAPDDARILFRSAQLAARDKDHQQARMLLEKMPDQGLTSAIAKGRLALLGKTCDKLGDHAAAFSWFERVNAHVKDSAEARRWDPGAYRQEIETLAASFAGDDESPWDTADAEDETAPVFLVGFPRSGTTLLDTILRSHPNISVLEEMQMVFRMRERLGGLADRERLQVLSADEIGGLRQAYLDELTTPAGEIANGSLVVDKLPLNIVHVGLINRVFPSAKFIFAQRHPCDCVLSCFMQTFKLNNPMANFLELESSAVLYDRIMRLWTAYRESLTLDVHTLVYEDLVADMEGTVTPLLEFLGLGWDERLNDYRQTALDRGRINTPSYNQVTEKLYTRAAGRWEGYGDQMEPVLPILMPWAKRFGY